VIIGNSTGGLEDGGGLEVGRPTVSRSPNAAAVYLRAKVCAVQHPHLYYVEGGYGHRCARNVNFTVGQHFMSSATRPLDFEGEKKEEEDEEEEGEC